MIDLTEIQGHMSIWLTATPFGYGITTTHKMELSRIWLDYSVAIRRSNLETAGC